MATQTENLTEPEHNDNWRIIMIFLVQGIVIRALYEKITSIS